MNTCPECDTPLVKKSRGPAPTYCSATCRANAGCRRAKADGRYANREATAAARKRAEREANARPCLYCGTTTISTRKPASSAFYCSRRCYQLTKASARRARSRNTHIDRQSIYQRDKWNCRLCSKPVAKTKTPPHPKAPVLDHIIPIAAGGEHTPANLQLAHFLCNSIKRHLGGGEQLMLFG